MRITLGVTDNAWAAHLRAHDDVDEANFWVPSGRNFMGRASTGEPFLFKTKAPQNQIVGGGFFVNFWELRVSEAWAVFGAGNGCADERTLHDAIQRYRERNGSPWTPDPTIGCIILRNLFFAPLGEELSQPPNWGRSIVQGKTYDTADQDWPDVEHAFFAFQGGARVDLAWDTDLRHVDLDESADRYGNPVLTRHRLGQRSFRLSVLDAYDNRCAITGSRMTPVLEAAHIRPYAGGGHHVVTNGLSLRSDIHRLYDRGYLAVDPDHRLRVSPRLRRDFGNGRELYEREDRGDLISLPADATKHPDRDSLAWHMKKVFLTS